MHVASPLMKEAIRRVLPGATHILCAWHLHKNCMSHIKDKDFCDAFKRCMYRNCCPEEFEEMWKGLVNRFQVHSNVWVASVYARKEMWATAFLRDKFCAGIRTTSRCEAINSVVKRFIKSRYSIYDLVQGLERVLKSYRNNELEAQFKSLYSTLVYSTGLRSIEEDAANKFTHAIFADLKEQIQKVSALVFVSRERFGTTVKYQICKFGNPVKVYSVLFDKVGGNGGPNLFCDCHFWSMHGIPCCHIFFVMKDEHIPVLPSTLVMKRWRKDAKTFTEEEEDMDTGILKVLRYGALCSASNWMSFLASKSGLHFRDTMDSIQKITNELEGKKAVPFAVLGGPSGKVGDPEVAKTKGAPKLQKNRGQKRVCSNCSTSGHNKRSCPMSDNQPLRSHEDELSKVVEGDVVGSGIQRGSAAHRPTFICEKGPINRDMGGGHLYPISAGQMFFGGQNINHYFPCRPVKDVSHGMNVCGNGDPLPSQTAPVGSLEEVSRQGNTVLLEDLFAGISKTSL